MAEQTDIENDFHIIFIYEKLIRKLLNMDRQDKLPNKITKLESLLEDNRFLSVISKEDKQEYHKLLYNATFEQFYPKSIIQIYGKNQFNYKYQISSFKQQLYIQGILILHQHFSDCFIYKSNRFIYNLSNITIISKFMNLGNYATTFYVILEGCVDVFIQDKKDQDCLYGARQLVKGDCMNDIALITGDKSLVQYQASENTGICSVLVLQKKDFNLVSHLLNVWLDMSIHYMKNLPLFWNQPQKQLYLFYLLTTSENFVQNEQIFLEGDKSELVYIIKQGEFGIYKHFQDLQFRKLNDVVQNKYLDSLGSTTVKLQEFQHNKNIQTKVIKENEMFGEEDVINRRNRSYSIICESMDGGELIVMSKTTFKHVLMGVESVRNYILSKLKVKQTETTRILDKQAGQVSSARIHILEKDQLKIATTQDFVKQRSFLNMSRHIYSLSNSISKIGDSIIENNQSINYDKQNLSYAINNSRNIIDNHNYNIQVVQNLPRQSINHMLNTSQLNKSITSNRRLEQNRLSLPSINQNILDATNIQNQSLSTKVRPYVSHGQKINNSSDRRTMKNKENYNQYHSLNNKHQQNLIVNQNESKIYLPSESHLGQISKQENNDSPKRKVQTEQYSQNIVESQIPNTSLYNVTPQENNDLQNVLNPKQILSSSNLDLSKSNLQERKDQVNDGSSKSSKNKRNSKLFDNFTRNSVLYLQKYQINQERKSLFGVGKKKDENDDMIDTKGKQLSEQIQQYIVKYEQQLSKYKNSSQLYEENNQPLSPLTKVIYKKPMTEQDRIRIMKKYQENELEQSQNQNKQRNFKLNFYQQKS